MKLTPIQIQDNFDAISPDYDLFSKRYMEAYEKFMIEVMRLVIHRDPLPEDGKDFHQYVQQGDLSGCWLAWKNMKLGRVTYPCHENGFKFYFEPCEKGLADPAVIDGKVTFI